MKLSRKIIRLPNCKLLVNFPPGSHRAPTRTRKAERGYVLITILLTVSLMSIAALAVLPSFIFELKRDQEDEMIHRGVQYTRAIRAYLPVNSDATRRDLKISITLITCVTCANITKIRSPGRISSCCISAIRG